jgi:nitrite reductase [NAD(P)H] small subunit
MAELTLPFSEIPDGGCKLLQISERLKIAIFRMGERVAAINNRCPHAGGSFADGEFDGTTVKCPMHSFRVNVWTGRGNAGKPVVTYAVARTGDQIRINVPE